MNNKKQIAIVTLSAIVLMAMQLLWISHAFRDYKDGVMQKLEQYVSASLSRELDLRMSNMGNRKFTRIKIKYADEMTEEERLSLKGDTIMVDDMMKKKYGLDTKDALIQVQADNLIAKGNFINLHWVDSLLNDRLTESNIKAKYSILWLDKDTLLLDSIGTLRKETARTRTTRLFPLGTKGLQFVQVKVDVKSSEFLMESMLFIIASALLVLIALGCVVFLIITIKKKDKLFKQREASVNGTVHDLKAPLNNVIFMMSQAKKKVTDTTTIENMDECIRQSRNMVADIESLLVTARKDREQIILRKQEVDLISLVNQAETSVATQYAGKNHAITHKFYTDKVLIEADSVYVTNVIRNLIENALKYSDDGVSICIRINKDNEWTLLQVVDDGWGIERKYQKRIFEQFFQVPLGKLYRREGYGVGLAFSMYIMEAHEGKITVESEPGKGSIFTCWFPN
ncbi:MAG: HAMP domain-containing histidine kinase [Bacteroidaceae bacterium]|nr:HAMP domain-containing histidine kinase [Bacteroidaceae bacterium]